VKGMRSLQNLEHSAFSNQHSVRRGHV